MSKLTETLNARHEDLDFELGMLVNNRQLLEKIAPKLGIETEVSKVVNTLESHLITKLDVDIEEIAEEEEITVDKVDSKLIEYSLGEAFNQSRIEMKSYLQIDNMINQIINLGGVEEEVQGLRDFKTRLESIVFSRYDITEEDLKEETFDE